MSTDRCLMDEAILELKRRGIHCIIVNSFHEAKNFIMYHIGVGTLVNIENSDEVSKLDLDKSVNGSGGTLVYGFDNKDVELRRGNKLIDNVEVHGSSYIYNNMEEILLGNKQPDKFTYKNKIIIIISLVNKTAEEMLCGIEDKIHEIETRCMATCLASEDISLILIRENI